MDKKTLFHFFPKYYYTSYSIRKIKKVIKNDHYVLLFNFFINLRLISEKAFFQYTYLFDEFLHNFFPISRRENFLNISLIHRREIMHFHKKIANFVSLSKISEIGFLEILPIRNGKLPQNLSIGP